MAWNRLRFILIIRLFACFSANYNYKLMSIYKDCMDHEGHTHVYGAMLIIGKHYIQSERDAAGKPRSFLPFNACKTEGKNQL